MRLTNGLELYRFRYKGSDRTVYVGIMCSGRCSKSNPTPSGGTTTDI
ncbi:MAG: hypothetical protein WA863_01370 [Methyloceanibacter sp.]